MKTATFSQIVQIDRLARELREPLYSFNDLMRLPYIVAEAKLDLLIVKKHIKGAKSK